MQTVTEKEIVQSIHNLSESQQRQVLIFVQSLNGAELNGTHGKEFLKLGGTIESSDLELMKEAITEGCEKIDYEGW